MIEIIFFACVVFVTLHFFHTTKDRSMIVGIVCIILNVLMYASPLTVMVCISPQMTYIHTDIYIYIHATLFFFFIYFFWQRMVIRTRSVKYMPFTLSVANFCNGVIWMTYALLKFDLFILVTL